MSYPLDTSRWVRPGGSITLDDASRCPLLRHALDLRLVSGIPPEDRENALLAFQLYDMRAAARKRAERRRELLDHIEMYRAMDALEALLDAEDAALHPTLEAVA